MKPVLYRYKDTESVIKVMDGYTPGDGWSPLYGSDEVKAATDAALERAGKACKKVADKQSTLGRQFAAIECGEAIRALKEKQ